MDRVKNIRPGSIVFIYDTTNDDISGPYETLSYCINDLDSIYNSINPYKHKTSMYLLQFRVYPLTTILTVPAYKILKSIYDKIGARVVSIVELKQFLLLFNIIAKQNNTPVRFFSLD